MPAPSQPTSAASSDELAAFYFKNRDTPCPNCAYNRRDDTQSKCPECGTAITLVGTDSMLVPSYDKLAKTGLLVLTLVALLEVLSRSYSTVFPIIQLTMADSLGYLLNESPANLYFGFAIFAYVVWILLFVITLKRWITRNRRTINMHEVARPAYAMLAIYASELIFNMIIQVFIP